MSVTGKKFVGLFLGLILIGIYYFLEYSKDLKIFLQTAFDYRISTGFGYFFILGLFKYISLLSGVILIITILYYQIKSLIRRNS